MLDFHLINGRRIMVRPAWTCHTEGNGMGCTTVKGNVVIAAGNSRTVVAAPELEAFLDEGRAKAMPPVEHLTVEAGAMTAGETATIKGDGWAGGQAYRLTLEGAGTKITLSEGVTTFGGFAWTGRVPADVPAGEYQLQLETDTGLCDGRAVVVRLAHNCVTEKLADSTRMACSQAEGQVIVHPPAGDPVRLQAPELAAWLHRKWGRMNTLPHFLQTRPCQCTSSSRTALPASSTK